MNGYENWETWNVAMWIGNDELLYTLSKVSLNYEDFLEKISYYSQGPCTPDGVEWDSPELNHSELDDLIEEHWNE